METLILISDADIVTDSNSNTWYKVNGSHWCSHNVEIPTDLTEYWTETKRHATQRIAGTGDVNDDRDL